VNAELKLNNIGKPLNELLEERLKLEGLPTCFGHMSPPFVKNTIKIDSDKFVKISFNIPIANKVEEMHLPDVINIPECLNSKKFALDKEGKNKIESIKTILINNYVEHVCKCIKCTQQESCYRITTCYLLSLQICTS